ncbi:MAG: 3-phosphoglycerate dehydrogenase [Lactobacillus sp.]|jgi:phosphoglycerate dehydrogenase-like enzyme|uniref:NAD(P)-dependent oxidoreductase n=1 Tax=Lacticaseibacillus suilingensis TaxID=2799577 RepID=A0ABW4BID6_9LACO|nr:NAD(P)-dependent oxidoreductase [Lacticaseibacillus suilingensis]MCI1894681.1 3-phosphoglycerate dehydrogenase [Lactobacillus sp.]MCI1918268.1 3-phosphoglycerate dehydrogenase [Lactobacillus sp.]MCI1940452.1 3-phosphoglycerate dehydrogenase [Lactobacillus sp.]MCI1971143.1 3-phosphoglycerate dehydrogenase [Lactobacillus sp.]MCI2017881.1 3-phosphoglycerate dehydrogenase [Lactobacillus sp.]
MKVLTLFALPAAAQAQLPANVTLISQADYTPDQASQIDVILGWNQIAQTILDGPNRLKFVQTVSAGVDYLPLAQLEVQGVVVANTSGIHAGPIASSTLAMILAFARGLFPVAHTWDNEQRRGQLWSLDGGKAVIFGTGHIGQAIAKQLTAQGMQVYGISRHGAPVRGFVEVGTDQTATAWAKDAQVLVNVMPLTASTTHFFNAAFFGQLEAAPLLVNVGRGESVDTAAMLAALHAGQLRGAALDVFETEPLPADSPLWQEQQVLITPHISGTVPHLRAAVADIFLPNLSAFAASGEIIKNQVDLTAGY